MLKKYPLFCKDNILKKW